jgi:hypothetical protein
MKLEDIASVIRSKNAGPRALTLDVMFAHDAAYGRSAQSPALTARRIAALYGVAEGEVRVTPIRSAAPSRSSCRAAGRCRRPGRHRRLCAQQHGPLLGIEL